MTFRAVDERDAVLACEWAGHDRDYSRHWGGESGWEEREEGEKGGGFHGCSRGVSKIRMYLF